MCPEEVAFEAFCNKSFIVQGCVLIFLKMHPTTFEPETAQSPMYCKTLLGWFAYDCASTGILVIDFVKLYRLCNCK